MPEDGTLIALSGSLMRCRSSLLSSAVSILSGGPSGFSSNSYGCSFSPCFGHPAALVEEPPDNGYVVPEDTLCHPDPIDLDVGCKALPAPDGVSVDGTIVGDDEWHHNCHHHLFFRGSLVVNSRCFSSVSRNASFNLSVISPSYPRQHSASRQQSRDEATQGRDSALEQRHDEWISNHQTSRIPSRRRIRGWKTLGHGVANLIFENDFSYTARRCTFLKTN